MSDIENPKNTGGEDEELRARESEVDRQGDQSGDPQRGGRLPSAQGDKSDEPRPADDSARSGIPSRSFNL